MDTAIPNELLNKYKLGKTVEIEVMTDGKYSYKKFLVRKVITLPTPKEQPLYQVLLDEVYTGKKRYSSFSELEKGRLVD